MDKVATLSVRWVYAGLGLLFLLLFYRPVSSGDIWFLLLMGQYVLDHGQVPHQEFFLYSSMGAPQVFGGWGFGTLAELCRRLMGLPGVGLFNAMLWSAVFVIALLTAHIRTTSQQSRQVHYAELVGFLLASLLIMYAVMPRSWFRPEVTMYLIWGVGTYLFESGRKAKNYKLALSLYPVLVWLESFLHTAGIILPLLLIGYAVEEFWEDRSCRSLPFKSIFRRATPWLLAGIGTIILPIFNPNGLDQNYLHAKLFIYNALQSMGLIQISQSELNIMHSLVPTSKLGEFLPAWKMPNLFDYYMLLAALSVLVFITGKQRRLLNCCHILPLAFVAVLHNRGLGLWALALFVPLVELTIDTARIVGNVIKDEVSTTLKALSIILLLSMMGLLAHKNGTLQSWLATPPLLEGAAAIQSRAPQGANVFTSHSMGAETHAALGQSFPVSFAAHVMFLDPTGLEHYNQVSRAAPGWKQELDKYQVIAIVSEPVNIITGDILHPLIDVIGSQEWELAARDAQAITFVRRRAGSPPSDNALRREHTNYWSAVVVQLEEFGINTTSVVRQNLAFAKQQLNISNDPKLSAQAALRQLHTNAQHFLEITR